MTKARFLAVRVRPPLAQSTALLARHAALLLFLDPRSQEDVTSVFMGLTQPATTHRSKYPLSISKRCNNGVESNAMLNVYTYRPVTFVL